MLFLSFPRRRESAILNFMDKVKIVSISKLLTFEFVICLASFIIPFSLSGPQILVGSLVNTLLFSASLKLDKKSLILVTVLPSLAAFSRGLIFGPATLFLFYFLPFIWAGNYILVFIFQQKISIAFVRIILASIAKASFLYLIAQIYFAFHIVPKIFVTSMGIIQFITALIGGLVTLLIYKKVKRVNFCDLPAGRQAWDVPE